MMIRLPERNFKGVAVKTADDQSASGLRLGDGGEFGNGFCGGLAQIAPEGGIVRCSGISAGNSERAAGPMLPV